MFSLSNRVESALEIGHLEPTSSRPLNTANSFAQQLATSIEGYLKQAKTGTPLNIHTRESAGQNSGGSQFLATRGAPESPAIATPAASKAAACPVTPAPAPAAPVTEADAYWAQQPAAVRVLRDMPDSAAKDALAQKLSNEGYAIDNQIMVMGWDPQTTMMLRQDYGYTSVPSYGQAFDPSKPPSGPIQVTTAFAVGTVQTPYALLMQKEAAAST
jgi:hypothetical protein